MILFTSDIDWAPEEVIAFTMALFEEYNIHCTFFCTHKSKIIEDCNKQLFEIGIHPNFNSLFTKDKIQDAERIIDDLLEISPLAKGVRSHNLTQSTFLLDMFSRKGLQYDSNLLLPYENNIKPHKLWNGLIRIPFNWEDDVHLNYGRSFEDTGMDLTKREPLYIFNFHPMHIFLNTEKKERYAAAKKDYHNTSALALHKNTSNIPGTKDLLIDIFEFIKRNKIKTQTLSEFAVNIDLSLSQNE